MLSAPSTDVAAMARVGELVQRLIDTEAELLALTGGATVGPPGCGVLMRATQEALEPWQGRYLQGREQVRFQASLLEQVHQPVCAIDLKGHLIYWNRHAETTHGWSVEEALGRPVLDFLFTEEDRPAAERLLEQLPTLKHHEGEMWLCRKDGSRFPALVIANEIHDDNGRILGFVGVSIDLTERHRVENDLRREAAQQAAILDALPSHSALIDRQGTILTVNAAWRRFAAANDYRDAEAGVGRNYLAVCQTMLDGSAPEAANVADGIRGVLSGQRASFEVEYACHSPSVKRWYRLVVTPIRSGESVDGAVAKHIDVTQRRIVEDNLRQSEECYRQSFENDFNANFIARPDGTIDSCNAAFAKVFGFTSREAAIGADLTPLFPEAVGWFLQVERLRREDQMTDTTIELRRRDGGIVQGAARLYAVHGEAGELKQVSGSFFDMTERKRLEEQVRQAQKMEAVGRLAGGVAHDFNNLLTIINGYSDIILTRLSEADPSRDCVRSIKNAGERAAGLTRQLLAFSRRQILSLKVLDLNAVLLEADKMLRRLIGEDISLIIDRDPALRPIKADPGQIEQVILNLAVNARDAMPRGGQLTLKTRNTVIDAAALPFHADATTGPHALLAISDTGHGMDDATRSRIFEPFFSTKGDQGTGLGLATVYGIVRQSGGHISVVSDVGRGSTFRVYLPQVDEPLTALPPDIDLTPRPAGCETLLLVEDDEALRALAKRILESAGYAVLEAGRANEALQLCQNLRQPLDLLVTDVVMPKMSGRQLADYLTALRPGLRVLFLSGYMDDTVTRHGVEQAETDFLQKPFTPSALIHKVRSVLDKP